MKSQTTRKNHIRKPLQLALAAGSLLALVFISSAQAQDQDSAYAKAAATKSPVVVVDQGTKKDSLKNERSYRKLEGTVDRLAKSAKSKKTFSKKRVSSSRTALNENLRETLSTIRTRRTDTGLAVNQSAAARASELFLAAMEDRDAAVVVAESKYNKAVNTALRTQVRKFKKANVAFRKAMKKAKNYRQRNRAYRKLRRTKRHAVNVLNQRQVVLADSFMADVDLANETYDSKVREATASVRAEQRAALKGLNTRTRSEVKVYRNVQSRSSKILRKLNDGKYAGSVGTSAILIQPVRAKLLPPPGAVVKVEKPKPVKPAPVVTPEKGKGKDSKGKSKQ